MWLNHQYEYAHEHARRNDIGSIEINDQYVTHRKPAWLVLLKMLGLALMVAAAVIAGVILIYSGLAFFFRPEPNTDNLGYCGGTYNDPTKISDDINRGLLDLHFVLGPGRFASETLLDVCVLLGIAGGEEVIDSHAEEAAAPPAELQAAATPAVETGVMRPNRFDD